MMTTKSEEARSASHTQDIATIPGTGFKLGFWFAQQGSIYVFVVEVFI